MAGAKSKRGVHYSETPRAVPFAELLGTGKYRGQEHFPMTLPSRRKEGVSASHTYIIGSSKATYRGKCQWHNTFFTDKASEIHTFADIGCALLEGAPTTVEAREAAPQGTRVLAVDVVGDFNHPELRRLGIDILHHSILDGPLPKTVDAIRFVGVAQYLTGSERRRALSNIHKSLPEGGFLISHNRIYRKSGRGFELIAARRRDLL